LADVACRRYTAGAMRVTEIFYSIQGEGSRRGRPCAFVRLTGCNLRCVWCDTAYAFEGGTTMSVGEVVDALEKYPVRLVCITGGEPLLQQEVHPLMSALLERGWMILLETGGGVDARDVDPRVVRILDLKAPGSGESGRYDWRNLEALRPHDELKVVVADRADYDWAREQIRSKGLACKVSTVLLSPVHGVLDPAQLARWMMEDGLSATLQLQEHKILWPDVTRGV
jgi:7-carboxy-7-deazaguanine synthase